MAQRSLPNMMPDSLNVLDIEPDSVSFADSEIELIWSRDDSKADAHRIIDFYIDRKKGDKGNASFILRHNGRNYVVKFAHDLTLADVEPTKAHQVKFQVLGEFPDN